MLVEMPSPGHNCASNRTSKRPPNKGEGNMAKVVELFPKKDGVIIDTVITITPSQKAAKDTREAIIDIFTPRQAEHRPGRFEREESSR